MKVVLAEKPSVARDIAQVLAATSRQEGFLSGNGYQVTWALGHLAELKPPEAYNPEWKHWSLDTLPMVPKRFELQARGDSGARKQLSIVTRLLRAADEIIGATDAGREGELIFRYILSLAGCEKKPLRRLWLSSLTPAAIRTAFGALRPAADYEHLYQAARCRSEADWIVGLNATRNFTVRHRSAGRLWSAGRVQTPVLAMLVERENEIRTFRSEPFWELLTKYRDTWFKFVGNRFSALEAGQEMLAKTVGQPFRIVNVKANEERVPPPLLYDLTELQRDMNRRYGMSAADVLAHAQALYESKLITYPRTDSRYLPASMQPEIRGVLQSLARVLPEAVARLELDGLEFSSRIVNDRQVTDHHAIIPTTAAPQELSGPRERVYLAIAVRLVAAFYPACRKAITIVDGAAGDVAFRARGVRILEQGWTELYPRKVDAKKPAKDKEAGDGEIELPEFVRGETGPHEPKLKEGKTSPPLQYTENTLLGAMETAGRLVEEEELKAALKERGLGTPATRAAIIETLLEREYIRREGKTLVATDLGRYLIALVQEPSLKSPELTGQWEAKLRQIESGRLDPREFMHSIEGYTRRIIESSDLSAIDADRLGDCPLCGKPVMEGKRDFGCSGWRDGCKFILPRRHRDREFTIDEIRRLLQKRILPIPVLAENGAEALLTLFRGAILELPVPAEAPRRGRRGKVAARGGRQKTPKRASKGKRIGPAARRASQATKYNRSSKAIPLASSAVGSCPLCKSAVTEQEQAFRCDSCKFTIGKLIAGNEITSEMARALLTSGRTPPIAGFQSRAGTEFSARLKIANGQVRFDFDK